MAVNLSKIAKDIFHPEEEIRILALTTVVQLTQSSVESLEELDVLLDQLQKATESDDSDVVFLARKGLNHARDLRGKFGARKAPEVAAVPRPRPKRSREEILRSLRGKEAADVATALRELASVGKPEDADLVAPYLKNPDARIRGNAVEAIERLADDEGITEFLSPLLKDENNRVRGNVAKALGKIGYPRIVSILKEMVHSPKLSMRESAVYSLCFIKGPEMVELLFTCLKDPYEGIRLRAVQGLARHKDPRAVEALKPLLNDIDIDVCEEAERALQFILAEDASVIRQNFLEIGEPASAPVTSPEPAMPTLATEGETVPMGGAAPPTGKIKNLQALADVILSTSDRERTKEWIVGKSREELEDMLAMQIRHLGEHVFGLMRRNEVGNDVLKRDYYDLIKFQEFLRKHQDQQPDEEGEGGVLARLTRKLKGEGGSEHGEAVARLESKIAEAFHSLGEKSVELIEKGKIQFAQDQDFTEKIQQLRESLTRS